VTRYLLDTNIVSELRRRHPSPAVTAWFDGLGEAEKLLSVLTVGELRAGVARLAQRDPAQAGALGAWVDTLVTTYADRLVPVDATIAARWGELNAVRPLPVIDGLLAATADVTGCVLATRNTKDLAGLGLRLVNPFEPGAAPD
jgi:predicted nucleic acid-binding protein